jgi:cyclohexanone monooxygenase
VDEIVALAGMGSIEFLEQCTPGYYNGEGSDAVLSNLKNSTYAPGLNAFNELLAQWRKEGTLEGMALS